MIRAKHGGFLRGVVDADRALTIAIAENADDFTVPMGFGKWLQGLGSDCNASDLRAAAPCGRL